MTARPLLSLDIGTRKVVGMLTAEGRKGLRIVAAERAEHSTRAMLDGQIHDVPAVAAVVGQIVERLARKAGGPLREVAVAAAGRALRTTRGRACRELSGLTAITAEEVFSLELEAVQAAQAALAEALREGEAPSDYHYVGHSVKEARLDGLPIGNLVGQRGHLAEIEVIGTFLPRAVTDSLQSVLQRAGLEMTGLTLEPIAALTVAVPPSMRHLNLALADVGAGTSDIALVAGGTVLAYDMVPMAGDEITEALASAYLLDFQVGEKVKRRLSRGGTITFEDILGQKQSVDAAQMIEVIRPAVERLAEQIGQRILRLNGGRPPQAVLLVGGGSLTPGLPALLAGAVGLPPQRVAVRGREAITGVEGARSLLSGPEAVTPIGIAVAARDRSTLGFAYVHVNDCGVRLFHPSRLKVADALLAAGISIKSLQGEIGRGLTVTLNGRLRIVRGTFGRPATILVNGQPAALDTPIQHGDVIRVEPGTPGLPGRASVRDLAPEAGRKLHVTVNGVPHEVSPEITVCGEPAEADRELKDNDVVVVRPLETIGDLLARLGYDDPSTIDEVRYTINGMARVVQRRRYHVCLNGAEAESDLPVRDGDVIEVSRCAPITIRDVVAPLLKERAIRVEVNGQTCELVSEGASVTRRGMPVDLSEPLLDNDAIDVAPADDEAPIFVRLLPLAGITPTPPPGKTSLVMRLNGAEAEFTTPISAGDRAEIYWE